MSWPKVALGDEVAFKGGGTPSRDNPVYWDGSIPWATVKDLNAGYSLRTTQESITEAGLRRSASNLISAGTVIVPTRMALGKAVMAEVDVAINQDLKAAIPSGEIDPRYLLWFFLANASRIEAMGKGATVKGVTLDQLRSLELPVPPMSEQRRIAAILDKADALRAKRREAIAKLDQLANASFVELCGSPHGPPISIGRPPQKDADRYVPLVDVARLATGHTPSRRVPEYWGGNIPWVGLTDVRKLDGRLAEETEQCTTVEGISNSSAVVLPAETVCLSRTASVGFCTILGREMATSQDFVNWICGDQIDPYYLMAAFRASRRYLMSKSTGSTHKTIYFPVAERFHVLLPDLSTQAKFADALRTIWRLRTLLEMQLPSTDQLFATIQHRAFSGTL